jgi:hypothetical protein
VILSSLAAIDELEFDEAQKLAGPNAGALRLFAFDRSAAIRQIEAFFGQEMRKIPRKAMLDGEKVAMVQARRWH